MKFKAKEKSVEILLRVPHSKQELILNSTAKRKIVRAGRRGGKTVVAAIIALREFLKGRRVLYATPTSDQVEKFWFEIKRALNKAIDSGALYKNETSHLVERPGTESRIRAKTAWNADTLRGDYADYLILDEWQLMNEEAWEVVGAPMLVDNNGDVLFIYTPPSLHSRSISKARDPKHAAKMFQLAQADTSGRWAAFHFTSHENPYISEEGLKEVTHDMSSLAYRQEILAEDVEEVAGALWTRDLIRRTRVTQCPDLSRLIIGVDPPGGTTECGIVVAGTANIDVQSQEYINWMGLPHKTDEEYKVWEKLIPKTKILHAYILEDKSLRGSPDTWAGVVISAYLRHKADRVVAEKNFGGDMVKNTIESAAKSRGEHISYKDVIASRGKAVRAEPVVALYEQGRVHHVGELSLLEEEQCTWLPGETRASPNRLDALVWAITELLVKNREPQIRWI